MGFISAKTDLLFGQHVFENSKFNNSRSAFVEVSTFLSKCDPIWLREPAPLFNTLDESVREEEYARPEG